MEGLKNHFVRSENSLEAISLEAESTVLRRFRRIPDGPGVMEGVRAEVWRWVIVGFYRKNSTKERSFSEMRAPYASFHEFAYSHYEVNFFVGICFVSTYRAIFASLVQLYFLHVLFSV